MNLPDWTREPLVHFVALGAVLYVGLTWGGSPPDPSSRVITVDGGEREKIAESFSLTMGRAPTDAELDLAIEAYVREEVLYREALRLGLDEGDSIVRRRLVSKMDMSASLAAETSEPDEAILRAYFEDNPDRYSDQGSERAKLSFDQAFFASEAAAKSALSTNGIKGEATSLPQSFEASTLREVKGRLGMKFAEALSALEVSEEWQGPLESGFGWHLVRLRQREAADPNFESLRGVVANDWRADQIRQRKDRAFEVLSSAYRIDIDR